MGSVGMTMVPEHATVLVIGGGPGGSYAASVLAREGVDVVLLEADVFPRYHIGESMLASMRFFLRFIELEEKFDAMGFQKKFGATFKINSKKEAYTDFAASLGKGGHAWNVVRSQADDLMFRHAGQQGAKIFDGTKVDSINFEPYESKEFDEEKTVANPGRATSAAWSRKDGSSGTISFDYIVDASGRAGIISTKYLKNRTVNEGLRNIANWTYWKGAKKYGDGSEQQNSPFFEATSDGSGWVWAIPLHNGTLSVGVVMRQDIFFGKKKAMDSPSPAELYNKCLELAPQIKKMLADAEMHPDMKMASDWSYSASEYAGPNFRMVGDAGCFIDPYFSSGVHLALTSGLAAAMTIQAIRRGDVDELTSAKWHSLKMSEGYTRFLLIVMVVLRQVRKGDQTFLSEEGENGFEKAFGFIQPVIQGVADAEGRGDAKIQGRTVAGVNYALDKFQGSDPVSQADQEEALKEAVIDQVSAISAKPEELEKLSTDELRTLNEIVNKQLVENKSEKNLESFTRDAIEGLVPRLERGNLSLVKNPGANFVAEGDQPAAAMHMESGMPQPVGA